MKRLLQILLGLVYLSALLFSLVLSTKAGASFFYWKIPIESQTAARQGDALAVQLRVDTRFYDTDTIVFQENGVPLESAAQEVVRSGQSGKYAIVENGGRELTLLFSPAEDSAQHLLLIRPYLLSGNWGGIYALLLLTGLVVIPSDPEKRRALLRSLFGFVRALPGWLKHSRGRALPSPHR